MLLALNLSLCGCGSGDQGPRRAKLFGTVELDGEQLSNGKLLLLPLESGAGQPSGADVVNGKYVVINKGGVIPGKYRVEITALRELPDVAPPDGVDVATEQYIPEKFNGKSELTLTVAEGATSMEHNFKLSGK